MISWTRSSSRTPIFWGIQRTFLVWMYESTVFECSLNPLHTLSKVHRKCRRIFAGIVLMQRQGESLTRFDIQYIICLFRMCLLDFGAKTRPTHCRRQHIAVPMVVLVLQGYMMMWLPSLWPPLHWALRNEWSRHGPSWWCERPSWIWRTGSASHGSNRHAKMSKGIGRWC